MALQSRTVHIPAGAGLDQRTREEFLEPGQALLRAENVRQREPGSLSKRDGFAALSLARLSGSRSAGYRHFPLRDQVCVIDGAQIDVYSPAVGVSVTKNRVPEALPTRITLPTMSGPSLYYDVCLVNGYLVVAAGAIVTSTGVRIHVWVLDATTYAVVRNDVLGAAEPMSPQGVKLAATGTTVAAFYSPTANVISAHTLSLSSSASINTGWSSRSDIITDWKATGATFDAIGLEDRIAVAYPDSSVMAPSLQVKTYSAAMALLETHAIATSGSQTCCALAGSNADVLWVAWNEGGTDTVVMGIQGNSLSTTLASLVQVVLHDADRIGIVVTGVGTARVLVSAFSSNTPLYGRSIARVAGATVLTGSERIWWRVVLVSRPFAVGGRNYASVYPSGMGTTTWNTQRCNWIIDVDDDFPGENPPARVVANVAVRQSLVQSVIPNVVYPALLSAMTVECPHHVVALSATKRVTLNTTQRSYLSAATGAAMELVVSDFASPARWSAAELNDVVQLSGGVPSSFGGDLVDEINFLLAPETPSATVGAAGSVTGTNIRYCAVYEKTDESGAVSWSAPSSPSAAVSPAAKKVSLATTVMQATTHHRPLGGLGGGSSPNRVAWYRSENNGAAPWTLIGHTAMDPTVATVSFVDDTASYSGNPQIYTPPGGPAAQPGAEQVHQCPPAFLTHRAYNSMLVGVADDGYTIWYSPQPISGEATWFNDVFQLPIAEGGAITALGEMDGTLFVFKAGAVFALTGFAPTGSGAQGGLGDPRRLSGDVGCIDQRSVVETSAGIFFQGPDKAIWLLTRAQTIEPIGSVVAPTTSAFPVCTSATLDAAHSLVYFELAQAEVANQVAGLGCALVFDLRLQKWSSVDRRKNSAGTADTPAQSGAVVYSGGKHVYSWLGIDGRVYVEDATSALDSGAWVTALWETPRLRLGLQQQAMFWESSMLMEPSSAAGVLVELRYDAADYQVADNKVWTSSESLNQPRLPFCPTPEKYALGFRVSDSAPASVGIGRGHVFVGLSVDLAPKQGSTQGTPHGDVTLRR